MRGLQQTGLAQSNSLKLEDGIKLTTFIPVRFVRHKARKVVVEPTTPGRMATPMHPGQAFSVDENLMSALARAFFWQALIDSGRVKNMTELAKAEKVGHARMQKMLKLGRLAPDLVEDIARGRQPVGLSLQFFVENSLPDDWSAQRQVIGALAKRL
ncbi:hypothetical protein [Aromatoleum bremense]|uniref:Bacteriophage-related protein n=1 Tax=Aromatoleum bremense TaxID=76115 RepID=A0ABX1NZY4_9RHOO|nr:hypothetical protein [Aromatoleum bremense]NMG17408.1 hypothetical protein [Aromatoleum bremense]QTQ33193.1 Uncharacterized protein pbN1_32050 [Aromatoleum bremense]